MKAPKKAHFEEAHRLVTKLKNEPGLGVLIYAEEKCILTTFYDTYWSSCPNSRRFVTG